MTDAPTLKLTNTLTRTKDVFRPIDPNNVRMYVCGPTVYDFAHIGNARPVIVFDVLFRLLRHLYGADHVTYVRNITDVDDKINERALRDFGQEISAGRLTLNEAIRQVTEKTANQFHADVKALGCLEPTHEPRATEFVAPRADGKADMISLIQSLITRGHAYETNGEVLFDTASMPDYGKLSGRNLDEQRAGARVAVDAHKKSPGDFVLWKQSSAEEPGWDATFTLPGGRKSSIRGRPGWHIECSAMSDALLWDGLKDRLSPEALARPHEFDIHGGGLDLIFPHHENEIAQSRCAHGTPVMANYWLHNGYLQVEGRKMAKSEGNFVTIHEVLQKHLGFALFDLQPDVETHDVMRRWNGLAARLVMLQSHYRAPIDWTSAKLKAARFEIFEWHQRLKEIAFRDNHSTVSNPDVLNALVDDLNTAEAIAMVRRIYRHGTQRDLGEAMSALGLFDADLMKRYDLWTEELTRPTQLKVDQRLTLIAAKNWPEADRIRDELLAEGIQLKDGKDPVTGERITTWEVNR